ncbi:unnamed protein product [Pieris macdunnoughi]|uniref:Uncharacterized protein n=1 Tax=Pieris macdunnoughi TaxID=345717 RepID=A0A821TLW2_9NEOP|nr:unnamed protein product [Pieris macdunnoughi]
MSRSTSQRSNVRIATRILDNYEAETGNSFDKPKKSNSRKSLNVTTFSAPTESVPPILDAVVEPVIETIASVKEIQPIESPKQQEPSGMEFMQEEISERFSNEEL